MQEEIINYTDRARREIILKEWALPVVAELLHREIEEQQFMIEQGIY